MACIDVNSLIQDDVYRYKIKQYTGHGTFLNFHGKYKYASELPPIPPEVRQFYGWPLSTRRLFIKEPDELMIEYSIDTMDVQIFSGPDNSYDNMYFGQYCITLAPQNGGSKRNKKHSHRRRRL